MTLVELARMVAAVREAQRRYFRTRSTLDLERSKVAERRLDKAVAEVLDGPSLFRDDAPAAAGGRTT